MKHTFLLVLVALLLLAVQGCEKKTTEVVTAETLAPPLGLRSITGDARVTLVWYASNYEGNFNGYAIYRMEGQYQDTATVPDEIPSGFARFGSVTKAAPCNTIQSIPHTGLQNGTTYSFLVVATNNKGEISQPSNVINDTPRPETPETQYDTLHAFNDDECGYELSYLPSDTSVIDLSDINFPEYSTDDGIGDLILELLDFPGGLGQRLWLAGTNDGGVMDLGYMQDWNDADIAPDAGYAPTGFSVYAVEGHVYAVKTGDNHYGKIQLIEVKAEAGWLSLKACYQTKGGERQYKPRP